MSRTTPTLRDAAHACTVNIERLEGRQLMSATPPAFVQTNLVSNGATTAAHTDIYLVNPWGVAVTKTGAIWVSDGGTGLSTVYDSAGVLGQPIVTIPAPTGSPGPSKPTGVVFNTAKAFNIP